MDFTLSERQKNIQWSAEEFARGEFDPQLGRELDEASQFPESIWKKACELGFIGVRYPKEYGGLGLGILENLLVIEAFCKVHSGIGSALASADLGSEILLRCGSREQKERLLLPMARGEMRWAVAFDEPEQGEDPALVRTTAEREDSTYILEGVKRCLLCSSLTGHFLLLCNEPKHGLITLVVERGRVSTQPIPIEKMGRRTVPLCELPLKRVRVSIEERIGAEGEGRLHRDLLEQERGWKATAQAIGMAAGALDRSLQYARQRVQFGKKLCEFQAIRHKLAEIAVSIETARWLTYRSALQSDRQKTDPGALALARIMAKRGLLCAVHEALQIFAGYGYMADQEIEAYYRDGWALAADLGTEEENKDTIAKMLLGG